MRDCYRPLLVFAPSANDARFREQVSAWTSAAAAMQERGVLLVPVTGNGPGPRLDSEAGIEMLSAEERAALRRRFHVAPGVFRVVLLGKDGGSKLSSSGPVPAAQLTGVVDGMPMRKQEMLQQQRSR